MPERRYRVLVLGGESFIRVHCFSKWEGAAISAQAGPSSDCRLPSDTRYTRLLPLETYYFETFPLICFTAGGVGKSAITRRYVYPSREFLDVYDPTVEGMYE
jgi:hypothetical protein